MDGWMDGWMMDTWMDGWKKKEIKLPKACRKRKVLSGDLKKTRDVTLAVNVSANF